MTQIISKSTRLAGLFFLGFIFFNYPILSLFNIDILVFGIPLLYLYLFAAWALFILLIAICITIKSGKSNDPTISHDVHDIKENNA